MFRRFIALLWLRLQIILSNKSEFLQVVMPAGLIYLYKFMMEDRKSVV